MALQSGLALWGRRLANWSTAWTRTLDSVMS